MLLLNRMEVAALLDLPEYIPVVEEAFRLHALGRALAPAIAHVAVPDGEFHIKAGGIDCHFGLKVNGGFFQNQARFQLPNIQGLIILSRADNGLTLAVMDSIEITIRRTAAATAVAAKYLARSESSVCTLCGCGTQGRAQLRALKEILPIRKVFVWSPYPQEMEDFAATQSKELRIQVLPATDLAASLRQSDVCVTCTPSRKAFVQREWIPDGMFIAAVGADSPDKQELEPALIAGCKIVADLRAQAASVGESHHAIALGLITESQIFGELGEIAARQKPGRIDPDEVIIFDSTGTALQDVAAAAAVYEKARSAGVGMDWSPDKKA